MVKFAEKFDGGAMKPTGKQLSEETAKELGLKDTDVEVESFVEMNCVQQDKEKYLCPLSNKKFKGKEYAKGVDRKFLKGHI